MIRLFISSTFRDMQRERDAIQKHVYPEIRKYGLEKGVAVDVCDLRWGIDYDSFSNEDDYITQIMNVCFSEIDDCKPYIVAIIGNNYGTKAPNSDKMTDLWKKLKPDLDIPENAEELSLTHWELEYSFLSKAVPDVNALCMFRKDYSKERDDHTKKLEEKIYKKKAAADGLITCNEYISIDEFEEHFISFAKKMIDEESGSDSSTNWVTKELAYFKALSDEKCLEFAGRKEYIDGFQKYLQSEDSVVLAYFGQSGIGKSSLMAYLFQNSSPKYDKQIILCGSSQKSSSYLTVLIEIIYIIESKIDANGLRVRDELYREDKAESVLRDTLKKAKSQNINLLIFVDAMDKMVSVDEIRLLQIFDENAPGSIKLICSQINDYDISDYRRTTKNEVSVLEEKDIKTILAHRLFDAHQKTRDNTHDENIMIKSIVEKLDKVENVTPLFIKIVIRILKMHLSDPSQKEKTNNRMVSRFSSVVENLPDNIYDLCWLAFEESMRFLFESSDEKKHYSMAMALGLIAYSNYGLRDRDLQCILDDGAWKIIDFYVMRSFLSDFFVQCYDGGWRLAHDIITSSVKKHFESTPNGEVMIRKLLFSYVFGKDFNDSELQIKEGLYLSYYFEEPQKTIEVFKKLGGCTERENIVNGISIGYLEEGEYEIMPIRELASKEFERIIALDSDNSWLKTLIDKDIVAVMGALSSMLEYIRFNDFSRRIPAFNVAERFWNILSIRCRNDLNKWDKGRSYKEKLYMATLCAEYAGVDYLDRIYSVGFTYYPKDFYSDENNFTRLTESQKKRAVRQLASLFNSNNSVLSYLYNYSNNVMKLMDSIPLSLKENEDCIRSYKTYKRNIIQYYSAIGRTEDALRNRLLFLQNDINEFFDIGGELLSTYKKSFNDFCNKEFESDNIRDLDFSNYVGVFSEILECIITRRSDSNEYEKLAQKLEAIASGFFVISYETQKIKGNNENSVFLYSLGINCADVAILLYGSPLVNDKKELLSSYIRMLQLYRLIHKTLFPEDVRKIINWARISTKLFIDQSKFLDLQTGKLLLETLNKFEHDIISANDEEQISEYKRVLDKFVNQVFI